ncbi:MAG: S9 family peptidase [Verrucomicrobia bacterium]|nr:MAG: S9 family peptidase [Verrucomicrobiota bacterium]
MSARSLPALAAAIAAVVVGCVAIVPVNPPRPAYPPTARTNVVDTYFGQSVEDPYRWLEDDNSPGTKEWVAAQNRVTFGYLEGIPQRAAIKERMTRLLDFERFGTPAKVGGRYFYTRNDGLQNQDVWYTATAADAEPTVLLDPNRLSADGTVSVSGPAVSEDGRLAAYQISASGSDWKEIRVREVATGRDLPDRLEWVKFSGVSWRKDGTGFYYSRYEAPKESEKLTRLNEFQKLCFHRVGTPQSDDAVVYERRDKPRWGFGGEVSDDGAYLVITSTEGTDRKNRVFYQDLARGGAVADLLVDFDASYDFVGNDGPVFWFKTDLAAPRGRIIAIDTRKPDRSAWREVLPQGDATLTGASVVGERLVADYLKDAHSVVRIHRLDGTFEKEVELPGIGSAGGFGGRRGDTETFYGFAGYTVPGRVYRYDFTTGKSTLWRAPKVGFNPDDFETKQVWVTSKDGTRFPMFVTHRKGLKLDGTNPTLLYGYGGFNISLTPAFSVGNLVWMEMGGVYAVPNLRGGGEYGEDWHQSGTKLRKQNVFDDFVAAGEWLVNNRYTQPRRLAIQGGSNGGLLVGACMTQRPDLYGACLPAVGVMDMLRFHKFTIGWAWKSDYGSSEDAEEFRALRAYSPYHNLRPGVAYPPTLVTTADHDDRVVPAHSFKFAARLQECQAGSNPVLIRIESKAGHGAGKPTAKIIEERSDQLAFLVRQFGMAGPR